MYMGLDFVDSTWHDFVAAYMLSIYLTVIADAP
jgi:hypothetical protein